MRFLFTRGAAWFLLVLLLAQLLPLAVHAGPPDPRFGAVEVFRHPAAASEAGVGWDRILFYWSELQPNGPEDWNGYHVPDDWLQTAARDGREVVAVLKHTPAWATDGAPGCGVPRGLDLLVDDPGNLWATFVRRVVSIYGDRVRHWVIWNEPDIVPPTYGSEWCGSMEAYFRLLKVAYLAAHQVDPQATIHLAGTTTWHDPGYLDRFLDLAAQDPSASEHDFYFDAVSLHIYFRTETVPQIIDAAQATLAAHGLDKPIWVNETNAPPSSDPAWPMAAANYAITLEEQASFLLQSFALALSAGAERVAVYKWLDNDLQPGFEPFGLIRPDHSRRPAYEAYRLITIHYAGTLSAREERYPLYTVVTLDRGESTTRVLWARTQAATMVTLPALGTTGRLIDQTGGEQIMTPGNGQYAIALPGARCADARGCIIGGPTYLLVEETRDPPPPPTTVVTATATVSTVAPTVAPTATEVFSPTATPWPSLSWMPSPTSSPTVTSSQTATISSTAARSPTPVETPSPTLTAPPSPAASDTPPPSPTTAPQVEGLLPSGPSQTGVLIVLVSFLASVALIGVWFGRVRAR